MTRSPAFLLALAMLLGLGASGALTLWCYEHEQRIGAGRTVAASEWLVSARIDELFDLREWPGNRDPREDAGDHRYAAGSTTRFGSRRLTLASTRLLRSDASYNLCVCSYGWPFHVYHELIDPADAGTVAARRVTVTPLLADAFLLGWPIWAGGCGIVTARRRRRVRRGRCPDCGYPRGTAPRCTECGRSFIILEGGTP